MMKRLPIHLMILALLLALPAQAMKTELPDWYAKKLHKWEEYKVLILKGKSPGADIDKLMASPDAYNLVVWQVLPENTREADVKRVLQWVNGGGCLWFQDSRLGQHFGFENAPVDATELHTVKMDHKPYGDVKKFPGADTLVMVASGRPHPTLEGVDAVQVFCVVIGEGPTTSAGQPGGKLSIVRQTPGIVPLLKINPTSQGPLTDRLVAALRPCGEGTIVFKPLVWEEQYTGGRFQYNILEWSTGFGVPDMTTSGPSSPRPRKRNLTGSAPPPVATAPAGATVDQVVFLDKHALNGTIVSKKFELITYDSGLRTGTVFYTAVRSIVINEDGARDLITLVDGQKIKGTVSFTDGELQIKDADGKVRKFRKSEILRVNLHEPASTPDKKDK